jgi:hypothetical protein
VSFQQKLEYKVINIFSKTAKQSRREITIGRVYKLGRTEESESFLDHGPKYMNRNYGQNFHSVTDSEI